VREFRGLGYVIRLSYRMTIRPGSYRKAASELEQQGRQARQFPVQAIPVSGCRITDMYIINIALLLSQEVELNRRLKKKTSTLFLDVKRAFDHVAKEQLLKKLKGLNLPISLIA
jgi:hypothetical protein